MTHDELDRVRDELVAVRKAMGLHLAFGRGVLAFGFCLSAGAVASAVASLLIDRDPFQAALFAAILVVGIAGLFVWTRRTPDPRPEVVSQAATSVGLYGVVWTAACGYTLAGTVGPAVGPTRTALLYGLGVVLLLSFTILLARAAVLHRERRYCAGLAVGTLLAAALLPVLDPRAGYAVAHAAMAVGLSAAAAVQWAQLRHAAGAGATGGAAHHAAD